MNTNDMLWLRHYTGVDAALVADLQRLPARAEAVADDPAYVWRAGLSTPRLMNDVSKMRIDQGSLTTADVVDAARAPATCAVVIWTFRFGSLLPGLREGHHVRDPVPRDVAPDDAERAVGHAHAEGERHGRGRLKGRSQHVRKLHLTVQAPSPSHPPSHPAT